MSTEANRIAHKLWSYCTVVRDDELSYGDYLEQLSVLLFLKLAHEQTQPPWPPDHREPCGDWLLGKLQRNAHHRARARTRALLLFQLRDALVSAPGPQPALCPSGAPLWG